MNTPLNILENLDAEAVSYDHYEYGLPMHDDSFKEFGLKLIDDFQKDKNTLFLKTIDALVGLWSGGVPNDDYALYNSLFDYCTENNIIIDEFNSKGKTKLILD